jgi:drug/metabolite transporter (DMT)-like permease
MLALGDRGDFWLGAAFIVCGELMFASMGVCIRSVSDTLPNESVVFFRNLLGLALLAPWLLRRGSGGLGTRVAHLHLLRGLAGVSAMYCFFYAIAHIPLAEAMLLKLTSPLFIPMVALLWLNESVTPRVWLAVGIGFGGVLLILHPGLAGISRVALIALLGGVFAAVAKVTVRRLSRTEPALRIVFYFALTGTLISSVPLLWAWRTPAAEDLAWLLGVGLLATMGQLCLTAGMSRAPAARMGAFGYFSVIFGAAYGWLLWDERLMWWTVAGSLLIFMSGLLAGTGRHAASRPTVPAARALES